MRGKNIRRITIIIVFICITPSICLSNFLLFDKIDLTNLFLLQELFFSKKNAPPGRTLICVHGYGGNSAAWTQNNWTDPMTYPDPSNPSIPYYDNIIAIDYYWDGTGVPPPNYIGGLNAMTVETDVNTIADNLSNYILDPANGVTDKIDFLCHSMGGLVVRTLICRHYEDLVKGGFIVDDIVMLGTPNKGHLFSAFLNGTHPNQALIGSEIFLFYDIFAFLLAVALVEQPDSYQMFQVSYNSAFINSLQLQDANGYWDKTPYGENDLSNAWPIQIDAVQEFHNDIAWTSIVGDFPVVGLLLAYAFATGNLATLLLAIFTNTLFLCGSVDGVIATCSAFLENADNIKWFLADHVGGMLSPTPERKNFVVKTLTEGVGESAIIEKISYNPIFEYEDGVLKNSKITAEVHPSPQGSEIISVMAYINKIEASSPVNIGNEYEYEIPMIYDPIDDEYYLKHYFNDGLYEVKIVATDDVGHIGEEFYAFYIIDDDISPPEITLLPGNQTVSDATSHTLEWEIFDYSGLSSVEVKLNDVLISNSETGSVDIGNELGTYKLEVFATDNDNDREDDQNSSYAYEEVTIIDDDIIPPIIMNLIIDSTFLNIAVSFDTIDDSSGDDHGIGNIDIFIDDELVLNYLPLPTETSFNFELTNDWIMEIGTHQVRVEITDADDDRLNDGLTTLMEGSFEVTFDEMKQFVNWEIDQLNNEIQGSSIECWLNPANNRKSAMNNKLIELKELISSNAFEDAYDKLLHDIKPKLTGLKTDENEEPWGNGVFNNPWVTCSYLQEAFRIYCNKILTDIMILISVL